ncbi:MAG: type 2 lanthipeptide synthetase LanM family protein [Pseudomonadota bacterium]
MLGEVTLAPEEPLPEWAESFSVCLEAMMTETLSPNLAKISNPETPIPFEDLFLPIASDAVLACSSLSQGLLAENAILACQRTLVARLSRLCAASLFDGFALSRMFQGSNMAFAGFIERGAEDRRTQYDRYIDDLRAGGLKDFFIERPVLARLVGTTVAFWITSTDQFARRLQDDIQAIGDKFNRGEPVGALVDLELGLSDAHNGAETVGRLTFECGLVIGYKPKDLHVDLAWQELLAWLADQGAPSSASVPKVVARAGYGWVEWVSPSPCGDEASAERHFRNAGALLCLFHLLRSTDFHYENVIAVADVPVPVDLETLLHPRADQFANQPDQDNAQNLAIATVFNSVLSAGYLPQWMKLSGEYIINIGGLNPHNDERSLYRFKHINTDGMRYDKAAPEVQTRSNVAVLNGKQLHATEYQDEFTEGFATMYRFLMERKESLLEPDGPLNKFNGLKTRAVLRATAIYANLFLHSLKREYLIDGAVWSANFDFLNRLAPIDEPEHLLNRIQASERKVLAEGSIPFFAISTDGLHLELNDSERLEDCFTETAIDRVRARASKLSETALAQELTFIGLAFQASKQKRSAVKGLPWARQTKASDDAHGSREASRIYNLLARHAIRGADGVTWIGTAPLSDEHFEVSEIGYSLYSGTSGVALFLAALARTTGSKAASELAYAALQPLRNDLARPQARSRLARTEGIGGGGGLGGMAYALSKIAKLLNDQALLAEAVCMTDLITEDAILADQRLDVLGGAAGALLSLLAVHRLCPNKGIMRKAVLCGRHLLELQEACHPVGKAWVTLDNAKLAGFSHGAAGIAYSLLQLDRVDGSEAWRDAAQSAIDYEATLYMPEKKNWQDLRFPEGHRPSQEHACQWCYGATGIGMARLGSLDWLDTAEIRRDVEAAIDCTEAMPNVAVDQLCCGNFGRLEFLTVAGRRLGREGLIEVSRARAAKLVEDAQDAGSFDFLLGNDKVNPGFHQGLAGIGYFLLRLDHPEILPSVLLWD